MAVERLYRGDEEQDLVKRSHVRLKVDNGVRFEGGTQCSQGRLGLSVRLILTVPLLLKV